MNIYQDFSTALRRLFAEATDDTTIVRVIDDYVARGANLAEWEYGLPMSLAVAAGNQTAIDALRRHGSEEVTDLATFQRAVKLALAGDAVGLRVMIEAGFNPYQPAVGDETLVETVVCDLQAASRTEVELAIGALVTAGVDLARPIGSFPEAMWAPAVNGAIPLCEGLLTHGANINGRGLCAGTILDQALQDVWLDLGLPKLAPDYTTDEEIDELERLCAARGHPCALRWLRNRGALSHAELKAVDQLAADA